MSPEALKDINAVKPKSQWTYMGVPFPPDLNDAINNCRYCELLYDVVHHPRFCDKHQPFLDAFAEQVIRDA